MNVEAAPLTSHVYALRGVLFQIVLFVLVGTLVTFAFSDSLIQKLSGPLSSLSQEKEILFRHVDNDTNATQALTLKSNAEILTLENGRIEGNLIYLRPGGFVETKQIVSPKLALFSPASGLMISLKVSLWGGVLLTFPFWILPVLSFISPALHPDEKRLLWPFIGLSVVFMTLGGLFAFYVTLPLTNSYFLSFNEAIGTNIWGLENYLDYTLNLIGAHALGFELMIVLLFLVQLQVVTYEFLKSKRKHAVVGSLIIGALLTPPDILSQLLLALPLVGFYEMAILMAWRKFQRGT